MPDPESPDPEAGASHGSNPPVVERNRLPSRITNPSGAIVAASLVIGLLGGVFGLWTPISELFDSGPTKSDIAVTFQTLPNGQVMRNTDNYLMPYDSRLPKPSGGGYCGPAENELLQLGTLTGAFVRFGIQNRYTGDEAAEIQVLEIAVLVRDTAQPRDGVLLECGNSGGDVPLFTAVQAQNEAVAVWDGQDSPPGPTSFVLESGETQLVNMRIDPQLQDVNIDLIARVVISGAVVDIPLNTSPINVPSGAAASPFRISPRGSSYPNGDDYWCHEANEYDTTKALNICANNRVFTKAEDRAVLAPGGTTNSSASSPAAPDENPSPSPVVPTEASVSATSSSGDPITSPYPGE